MEIEKKEQPKTVSIAPKEFIVEIDISPVEGEEYLVAAKMRRPRLEEDHEFAQDSAAEYLEVNGNEEQLIISERPSHALFDQISLEVKGYRFGHEPEEAAEQWRTVDEDVLKNIPGTHKAAFVRNMRHSIAKYVGSAIGRGGFVLGGGGTLPVELTIGTKAAPLGMVRFEVPEPEESERLTFENEAMKFLQGVHGDQRKSRTVTDLKKCVQFFQTLMQRPGARISDNGTINGRSFSQCESDASRAAFLAEIDPTYQVKVISAALVKYSARIRV